jgi:hypothetical protein
LIESDGVCTLSKVTALQLRKSPALVDTLTEGSGAAESTILHLPGVKRHTVLTVIPVISYPYAPLTVQGIAQYLTQYPLKRERSP